MNFLNDINSDRVWKERSEAAREKEAKKYVTIAFLWVLLFWPTAVLFWTAKFMFRFSIDKPVERANPWESERRGKAQANRIAELEADIERMRSPE